jgi:hypothetical protein
MFLSVLLKRLTIKLMKLPKKLKIRPCQKLADAQFSLYIRVLNADEEGYCLCFTCGKKLPWRGSGSLHAGHFIGREHIPTRYDERNVKPQCDTCNTYHEGEHGAFALNLTKIYGEKVIEELVLKSNGHADLIAQDYLDIRDKYKELTKKIVKEKHFFIY